VNGQCVAGWIQGCKAPTMDTRISNYRQLATKLVTIRKGNVGQ